MHEEGYVYAVGGYGMGVGGWLFMILLWATIVFSFWRVFAKAGYAGAWGLLAIIPAAPLFLLLFLALSRWPALEADRRG